MEVPVLVRRREGRQLTLELLPAGGCVGCSCGGRGEAPWFRYLGSRELRLETAGDFQPGQRLTLHLADEHLLLGALAFYGLPLLALLLALALGRTEVQQLLLAPLALVLAALPARFYGQRWLRRRLSFVHLP